MYSQTTKEELQLKIPEFKQSTQVLKAKERTWETALADLDNDGDLDIIFTSLGEFTSVFFNDGKGFFKDSDQLFDYGTHGVAIGDLDNDGDEDLFFAVLEKNKSCAIYANNGKGYFTKTNINLYIETSEIVRLIDYDGDGDLDAYLWYSHSLYENDGKGNFKKSKITPHKCDSFHDLNEDGLEDMVIVLPKQGFRIYLNDKGGDFHESCFLQKRDLVYSYTNFADMDNDGDVDIIFSNGTTKEKYPAGILWNNGNGKFTDSAQKLSTVGFGFIGTGDLNNDGWIDIIITDRDTPARVWLNQGKGQMIDSGITLGEGGLWNNCTIKDLDNDGDMDVFITKVFKGSHGLWFNKLIN